MRIDEGKERHALAQERLRHVALERGEILLGAVPEEAKARFLERTAGRLQEKDRAILRAYFGAGMRLKQASEALYLHKNTLQYQLDRIHRETGYNPREFADAVILYLALKL